MDCKLPGSSVCGISQARILEWVAIFLETGHPEVDGLLVTRGMLGMLNTVFLILCAMCFGACMQASGMIARLARVLNPLTRTRTGLVASTVTTGTVLNGIVSLGEMPAFATAIAFFISRYRFWRACTSP